MSGDFPIPELKLKHLTNAQLPALTSGWERASGTLHDAAMRSPQDRLHHSMTLTGKHGSHFATTIGEGCTKQQEELFETFGSPQDYTGGDVNYLAPRGHIHIGIVKPVWIRLVRVVGIIAAPDKCQNFLGRHRCFLFCFCFKLVYLMLHYHISFRPGDVAIFCQLIWQI